MAPLRHSCRGRLWCRSRHLYPAAVRTRGGLFCPLHSAASPALLQAVARERGRARVSGGGCGLSDDRVASVLPRPHRRHARSDLRGDRRDAAGCAKQQAPTPCIRRWRLMALEISANSYKAPTQERPHRAKSAGCMRTIIIGAGEAGRILARDLKRMPEYSLMTIRFLDN